MNERDSAELERDKARWKVRRRITLSCVAMNVLIIAFYILSVFTLDSTQTDMLKEFNSIAIAIIGGNFSVIIAYYGLNTYEESKK